MKKYLPTSYASAAIELVSQGYSHEDIAHVLLTHLKKAKRLTFMPAIVAEIEERVALGDGQIIDVYSAQPLDEKSKKEITQLTEKLYKAPVTLRTHEDSSLVGGLTLKNGDEVIDFSVATLVSHLHTHIKQDNQ